MKVVYITGNHPRHLYIARCLADAGYLSHLIVEERETFLPEPPKDIDEDLKALFKYHFRARDITEHRYFGEPVYPNTPDLVTMKISVEQLNTPLVQNILREAQPDLLLSFGCHFLTDETLACVKGEKWNCHGGLSPWYKGVITHFWPSYMLEPQMTGTTIHDLSSCLDAGDVVHQLVAPLERGDKLHDLAAKCVKLLGEELPILINKLASGTPIEKRSHRTQGMLWTESQWRPEHLRMIYQYHDDNIVDQYLDGKFHQKSPVCHRQF